MAGILRILNTYILRYRNLLLRLLRELSLEFVCQEADMDDLSYAKYSSVTQKRNVLALGTLGSLSRARLSVWADRRKRPTWQAPASLYGALEENACVRVRPRSFSLHQNLARQAKRKNQAPLPPPLPPLLSPRPVFTQLFSICFPIILETETGEGSHGTFY